MTAQGLFAETDEQELLRESVRGIAARYGHAYYADKARGGGRMDELWQELGEHGFIGVNLPEAYGGGGMGMSGLQIVAEECAAAGCPVLLLAVSPTICGSIIARFGSEEQKQRWLPGIASGELKMAFAITEAQAGSNSHRLATVAVRTGEGYFLTGSKHFITGVDEAQAVLVVARTEEGLSLFIVDTDAAGLERQLLPVEIVAPEKQWALYFSDVYVPADRLLGREGEGLRLGFCGLNPERIMGAATVNGIARYALDKAAAYARERVVWDVPIGAHQGIAHPLAKAKIETELARLATQRAAWLYDQGLDAGEASNMAKYAAAEACLGALDQAIQTYGGMGLAQEVGLADLWFAARLVRTAPVSREMILNFVAQHSLGLPRSY